MIHYHNFYREALLEAMQILRTSSRPQVEQIVRIMKKWAKENRIPLN